MHDCFISYSHKDRQIATIIQGILEQNGIKCWIDYRDSVSGVDYAASIVRAIKSSRYFILVLSSNSSHSAHVLNEINSAANAGKTIIPFKVDDAELTDSIEYYLGRTHWMDALTPPLEEHIKHLVDRIKNYNEVSDKSEKETVSATPSSTKKESSKKGCRMLKYQELLELGYTSASISIQLVENDYIICNGIDSQNEGSAEQWEEFLRDNSDTFQYLIDENNAIVGDWSIVALTDEAFDTAVKGELLEESIDINITEMICFPDLYNGYILSFSVLPDYRTMENYNLLIDSFLEQMTEYAKNGIFFKKWCINVFSREIEAMVKQLGFKFIANNKVFGKVYCCDFIPLPGLPIYKKHPELVKYYEEIEL
ncbi:MAG: toll/interleukin-1 receptor domain-containing protein [Clostridia bacterium]|nr:toll/interleukin-1 receptor domain-containing protein [Clostridia bacterium]